MTDTPLTNSQRPHNVLGAPVKKWLGGFALLTCILVIIGDVTMWFLVKGYSPISQTISELAAGPHHWIQDAGILLFVGGVICLTIDLFRRGEPGWKPWLVRLAMLALALDVALIALWNEYGDGEPGGLVIHIYLVAALYPLIPAILWFGTSVLPASQGQLGKLAKVAAILWLVTAPIFFVVPDSIDGLYERGLGMFIISAVAIAALRLYKSDAEDVA